MRKQREAVFVGGRLRVVTQLNVRAVICASHDSGKAALYHLILKIHKTTALLPRASCD
jgi:hypothetical protein